MSSAGDGSLGMDEEQTTVTTWDDVGSANSEDDAMELFYLDIEEFPELPSSESADPSAGTAYIFL
jgi:hypothetical protein